MLFVVVLGVVVALFACAAYLVSWFGYLMVDLLFSVCFRLRYSVWLLLVLWFCWVTVIAAWLLVTCLL